MGSYTIVGKVNRQSIFSQLFNLCDIKCQRNRKIANFHKTVGLPSGVRVN